MLKAVTGVPSRVVRARRYLSTLISLWVNPIRLRPFSEFAIIICGLIAKLAPLIAFILTVQFAVWLISPDRAPNRLKDLLAYDSDPFWFHAAIVTVPIVVFLIGSIAQKLTDHLSIQVRRRTAYALIEASVPKRLAELDERSSQFPGFFREIRADYQTVHRSVNSANNMLNSLATVIIAGMLGFFIAPLFVIILLVGLSILGAAFVAWRHTETNRLLEQKRVAVSREIALQNEAQKILRQNAKNMTFEQKHALMRSFLATGIGNPNELDDRFRSNTNLASIFAPLVGVTALLAFLAGEKNVTEERAAQLVMLVLVLRFCIGNLQSVITAMIGITRDYSRLTQIFQNDSTRNQDLIDYSPEDDSR